MLGAYLSTDLRSWRVKLLLAPAALGTFCAQHNLPRNAVQRWMRESPRADGLSIAFGWFDQGGRCDPFWLLPQRETNSLQLLRSAQRFLLDFAEANRAFCDTLAEMKVGDGADDRDESESVLIDEDAFVDQAHEHHRARASAWCQGELQKWSRLHAPHWGNPLQLEGFYQSAPQSANSQRKTDRVWTSLFAGIAAS